MAKISTYYFVSKTNFDEQYLLPRIPKNRMKNENGEIPRICVSKSINGCLTAVGGWKIGDIVFVHTCTVDEKHVYDPSISEVEDACFTGEQWILEPVEMTYFTKIEIKEILDCTLNNMENTLYSFKLVN